MGHNAPLVWRCAAPAAAAGERGSSAREQPLESVFARKAAASLAPQAPAIHEQLQAPRAAALDAAFVDRLAEDVMRRMDKRLRIERERRGL